MTLVVGRGERGGVRLKLGSGDFAPVKIGQIFGVVAVGKKVFQPPNHFLLAALDRKQFPAILQYISYFICTAFMFDGSNYWGRNVTIPVDFRATG